MSLKDDPTALVSGESVMSYINGNPEESKQFDFLLGEWDTSSIRYHSDGSEIVQYNGNWSARKLHNGRMILDEFIAHLPDQTEISYMATIRTYSPESQRWEMTFLVAHQGQLVDSFTGVEKDGEMHLKGEGKTLDGSPLLFSVRFFSILENSFEWENKVSLDAGVTWWRDSTISASRKIAA